MVRGCGRAQESARADATSYVAAESRMQGGRRIVGYGIHVFVRTAMTRRVGIAPAWAKIARPPSAADLTFLSALPRVLHRNVKSKAALES
jgi:hypothetical protein